MILHDISLLKARGLQPTGAEYRGKLPNLTWRQRQARAINVHPQDIRIYRTAPDVWTVFKSGSERPYEEIPLLNC
jgi:hypothetical protein